jgi:hypothetical protein
MTTTLSLLKAGKAVIYKEKNFVKGYYAIDKDGLEVSSGSSSACKFCSMGALASVAVNDYLLPSAFKALVKVMGSISKYNDNHTHAEVLAKWDEAILNEQLKESNV